jgi:hypothetical protein
LRDVHTAELMVTNRRHTSRLHTGPHALSTGSQLAYAEKTVKDPQLWARWVRVIVRNQMHGKKSNAKYDVKFTSLNSSCRVNSVVDSTAVSHYRTL